MVYQSIIATIKCVTSNLKMLIGYSSKHWFFLLLWVYARALLGECRLGYRSYSGYSKPQFLGQQTLEKYAPHGRSQEHKKERKSRKQSPESSLKPVQSPQNTLALAASPTVKPT